MAEPTGKSSGLSQQDFEGRRREIALSLLQEAHRFMVLDNDINASIARLMNVVVEYIERNPRVIESQQDMEQLVRDLNARFTTGEGMAGGDILGGGFLQDFWDFVKDLLKDEKAFIEEIICHLLGM